MRGQPRRRIFDDDLPKTHDVRYGLLFLFGLVGILLALYAIGFFVAGNRLPSGTTIGGIDVGGMTPGQARTAVQEELAPRVEQPLRLTAADATYRIHPQRAGLAFDIEASVDTALGGESWDPRHMVRVLLGGEEIEPRLVVDQQELDATLAELAADVERAPQDATVSFQTGRPQVEFGRTGQVLAIERSQRRLVAAVQAGERTVRLPVTTVDPTITNTEASTFAGTVATRAVSEPVTLRFADTSVEVDPAIFAPALRTEVVDSDLRLTVDGDTLYGRSRGVIDTLPHQPVNAEIGFGRSRPVVTPSRTGVTVTPKNWADAVLTAVSADRRRSTVTTSPDEPRFTTADARRLGVRNQIATDSVSSATVSYGDLSRAARQLSGVLLKPGETMSFLDTVDASDNKQAASVVAGATHVAAFRAGVTVLSRTPVVYYNPKYPRGLDARVSPPNRDLVLRNDSPYGVYLHASVERLRDGSGRVRVDVWSTEYWQLEIKTSNRHSVVKPGTQVNTSKQCSPRRGTAGFEADVTRLFFRSGEQVNSDVTHTEYAPLDRVVCR